jgi:hypothetical protein
MKIYEDFIMKEGVKYAIITYESKKILQVPPNFH